jgi:antitoxin CptB
MVDDPQARDPLDVRRRKLRFRSWHRGMREMDLILGPFADARLDALTGDEMDQYERLLDRTDTELLPYVMGGTPLPADGDLNLLRKVIDFRSTLRF